MPAGFKWGASKPNTQGSFRALLFQFHFVVCPAVIARSESLSILEKFKISQEFLTKDAFQVFWEAVGQEFRSIWVWSVLLESSVGKL